MKIKKKRGGEKLRHGKKPTRAQKIRLGQAVIRQKQNGELVIIHKHTDRVRVIPQLG